MTDIVILCIEDEPEVREAIVRDLAPFAEVFSVEEAEDVAEAEEVLTACREAGRQVGLILCDHVLPGEAGVDFLVRLNAAPEGRGIRKVLITGQAGHEDTIRALNEAQLDYYLAKPWTPGDLREAVRSQLTAYVLTQDIDLLPFVALLDGARLMEAIAERRSDK